MYSRKNDLRIFRLPEDGVTQHTFEIKFKDPNRLHVFLHGISTFTVLNEFCTHYGGQSEDVKEIVEIPIPLDPKTRKGDLLK